MRMKKILCLLFAAAVSVSMLSACGQETQAQPQTQTETAAAVDEDGRNPVMNFIGNYRSDRCTLLLEADGMTGAKVTAHQTNDAAMATDAAEWELSGEFDEVSMRITYTNAVKKLVSYTQAGEVAGESVVYQNGSGYIRLNDNGTLTWHDDNDPELASRTFGYVLPDDLTQPVEDIPSTTSAPVATTPAVIPQTRVSATAARATGTTKVAPPITTSTTKPAATTATTQPTTTTIKPTTTTTKPTTTTTKPNATTTTTKPTAATTQPTTKPAASSTTEESVQNPLANYAGTYQSGRCSLTITPNGKNNATITATWGNSASSAAEWKMHASYIEDTQRLTYSDCTKKTTTYDENGNVVEEKVDYSGGVGRLQLFGDGTLRWENEEETDVFAGMVFSRG